LDNFFSENDKEYLLSTLRKYYTVSIDDAGRHYCGLTLDWNYNAGNVDISMPKYTADLLDRLIHPTPKRPQHAPHEWTVPAYGKRL